MRLRIASLNVWALPWPVGREVGPRMRAIGAHFGELDVDVVALQEVWREDAREILIEAGRGAGFGNVWHSGQARGGSGLLVLTRLPFAGVHFEPYELRGLPQKIWHGDYHGGKGFAAVRLETPAGEIALVDTHLHARYGPVEGDEYLGHRMGQVVQLADWLQGVGAPVIAVGDFNFEEDGVEYRVFRGLTGLEDAAVALDRRQPTIRAAHPYSPNGRSEKRIDYAFARAGTTLGARFAALRRIYDGAPPALDGYSDHDGVLAEIELVSGAGAEIPPPDPQALALASEVLERGRIDTRARRRSGRTVAATSGGVGVAALALAGRPSIDRRKLLRAAGVLALANALGIGALAELSTPEELTAYDAAFARLQGFAARLDSQRNASRTQARSS